MATVINLDQRRPDAALERLNRQTGLDFRDWPESLLDARKDEGETARPQPQHPRTQSRPVLC